MKKRFPATPVMLLLAVAGLLVMVMGNKGAPSGFGKSVSGFLGFALFAAGAFPLFLTKTKDGRRIKESLVDPILKPQGTEQEIWDENGRIRSGGADGDPRPPKKHVPLLIIAGVAVAAILAFAILQDPFTGYAETSRAVSDLLRGITSGDFAAVAQAGKTVLHGMLQDLRFLGIVLLITAAGTAVVVVILKLRRRQAVNEKTEGETENDFWNRS